MWYNRWLSELKEYARKAVWETQLLYWALSSKQRQRTPFLWVLMYYFPYASSNTCSGQWEYFLSLEETLTPSHTDQDNSRIYSLFHEFGCCHMGKYYQKKESIFWKVTLHKYYGKQPILCAFHFLPVSDYISATKRNLQYLQGQC